MQGRKNHIPGYSVCFTIVSVEKLSAFCLATLLGKEMDLIFYITHFYFTVLAIFIVLCLSGSDKQRFNLSNRSNNNINSGKSEFLVVICTVNDENIFAFPLGWTTDG